MALIRCPRCGKEINDRSKLCPYCRFVPINGWQWEPTPPNKSGIKISAICAIISIALIGLGFWLIQYGGVLLILMGIVPGIIAIGGVTSYSKEKNAYQAGPAAYQKYKAEEFKQQGEMQKQTEERVAKKYNYYRYKCPMCGSTRIVTLSTAKKAISAEAFGLGSRTIGKTYQCDECKYMW